MIVILKIWNLKKTFDEFENKSSGTVELSVVPTLFRILNIQTSAESLEMAARQLGLPRNRDLDFQTFVELSSQFISEEDKETTIYELKEAFRYCINYINNSNTLCSDKFNNRASIDLKSVQEVHSLNFVPVQDV